MERFASGEDPFKPLPYLSTTKFASRYVLLAPIRIHYRLAEGLQTRAQKSLNCSQTMGKSTALVLVTIHFLCQLVRPRPTEVPAFDLSPRANTPLLLNSGSSIPNNHSFQKLDLASEEVVISVENQVPNGTFSINGTKTANSFVNDLRDWNLNLSKTKLGRRADDPTRDPRPDVSNASVEVWAYRPWEWMADPNFFKIYAAQVAGNCYHVRFGGKDQKLPSLMAGASSFHVQKTSRARVIPGAPSGHEHEPDSEQPGFVEMRPNVDALVKEMCLEPNKVPALAPHIKKFIERKVGTRTFNGESISSFA